MEPLTRCNNCMSFFKNADVAVMSTASCENCAILEQKIHELEKEKEEAVGFSTELLWVVQRFFPSYFEDWEDGDFVTANDVANIIREEMRLRASNHIEKEDSK